MNLHLNADYVKELPSAVFTAVCDFTETHMEDI